MNDEPLTQNELAHLRAVTEKATPGKRHTDRSDNSGRPIVVIGERRLCGLYDRHSPMNDAEHIAAFDVPTCKRLLDDIAAANEKLGLAELECVSLAHENNQLKAKCEQWLPMIAELRRQVLAQDSELRVYTQLTGAQREQIDHLVNFARDMQRERTAAQASLREAVLALSKDMHEVSSRPCQTCRDLSKVLGEPFGCYAYQKSRGIK